MIKPTKYYKLYKMFAHFIVQMFQKMEHNHIMILTSVNVLGIIDVISLL
jgi:hypothetical protein